MRAERLFLTGGTGFIGSNLIAALDTREIHLLTLPGSEDHLSGPSRRVKIHLYDGSTQSVIDAVANSGAELVIHLAACFVAEHKPGDIERLVRSNVLLGAQLLEGMRLSGTRRLLNTGTSWQHYENSQCRCSCLYAATKQAFEALIDFYVDAHDFRVATLKLFDTYGPGDPRPKLFNFLRNADASKPFLMSEGKQLIDLVYVDDVIRAFLAAEQWIFDSAAATHERFGISSGKPRPLREIVERYLKEAHSPLSVQWGARPYRAREVMQTWTDFTPLPGWHPKIDLNEGLSRLIDSVEGEISPVHR